MKKFTLFWLNGDKDEVEGATIASAMNNAGYGAASVEALDFFCLSKDAEDYEWDTVEKCWFNKKIRNSKVS